MHKSLAKNFSIKISRYHPHGLQAHFVRNFLMHVYRVKSHFGNANDMLVFVNQLNNLTF